MTRKAGFCILNVPACFPYNTRLNTPPPKIQCCWEVNTVAALTQCETILLEVILEVDHHMTLPEIVVEVNRLRNKNWSRRAVSAFLKRLRKKNYIDRRREAGKILYYPLCDRETVMLYLNAGDQK